MAHRSQAFAEALELLRWGVQYDPLFGEHSACRGRLVNFELDKSARIITFLPSRDVNPHFFCSQVEAEKAEDQRQAEACPKKTLSELLHAWFNSMRITNHGIHFNEIARSGAIDVAMQWMEQTCMPELSGGTELLGCTVADLRRVLASLYVYSLFVTSLEDATDSDPNDGFRLMPHLVSALPDEMVRWLARLSQVGETNVQAIVSTLTFDHANPHVTLAQQPFVSARSGRMFLSPRLIAGISLSLPKMYISAVNRSHSGKRLYDDKLSNAIETNGVRALADSLRKILPSHFQV